MLDCRSYGWDSAYIVLPIASKVRIMLVVIVSGGGGFVPVSVGGLVVVFVFCGVGVWFVG